MIFSKKQIQPSICSQVAENFKRSLKNIVRNPAYSKARIMQSIVSSSFCGFTWKKSKYYLQHVTTGNLQIRPLPYKVKGDLIAYEIHKTVRNVIT